MAEENFSKTSLSPRDRALRMKLCIVLGVLFICIAFFIGFTIYNQISNGFQSSQWPHTQGEILSSEVERVVSHGSKSKKRVSYQPKIHYSYEVAGKEHQGTNLCFAQDGVGKAWAEEKVKKYPVGRKADVFYKAEDPTVSVLETGVNIQYAFATSGVVLVFCIIFLLLAYACYWDYKRVKAMKV